MERGAGEYTVTRAIVRTRATSWDDAEPPAGPDHHHGPSAVRRLCIALRRQRLLQRQIQDAEEKQDRHMAFERAGPSWP